MANQTIKFLRNSTATTGMSAATEAIKAKVGSSDAYGEPIINYYENGDDKGLVFGIGKKGGGVQFFASVTEAEQLAGGAVVVSKAYTNSAISTHAGSTTAHAVATTGASGFMSASDKAKLDGIATGANKITVDSALNSSSTNPVQNQVIKKALDGKSDKGHTHNYAGSSEAGGAANSVKANMTIKLNSGSTEGADLFTFNGSTAKTVNITPSSIGAATSDHTHDGRYAKNAFAKVQVGSTAIDADTTADTLTIVAGTNITITPDSKNDKITISNTLPAAGDSLGGVKSGGDVTISNGVISVNDDSHNHNIGNVDGLSDALAGKVPTSRTVNGKALSDNVTLTGADVKLNGYAKAASVSAIGSGDTVNVALGKLEKALDAKAALTSPNFGGTPTAPTAAASANTTQIATTEFVQAAINSKLAANDAMMFKGVVNAASGLPATHEAGWTYKVGTDGTYVGQKCEVGDMIICITDGTAANNADWSVIQNNIDGAVTGPTASTNAHVAVFDGATGKVIKDSGFTIGKSVPADAKFSDTTYSAGDGISLSGNKFNNSGVRAVVSGTSANQIKVNTNGTEATITINNVANASNATKATQDSSGQKINTTYIKGLSVNGRTITYTKGDNTTATITTQDNNTTYTFASGTNQFTVTPSGGSAQTVKVTPSIAAATSGASGLMTADMVKKLNGITASADAVSFTQTLKSGTEIGKITINGNETKLFAPTVTTIDGGTY